MLRVTKLADYATVVMTYMARELDEIHNARDIASHTHIALPTVSKILKLMARRGLLSSQRGVKGGYKLTRKPVEITVAQILSAVDGDLGITDCSRAGLCSLEPHCLSRSNWLIISHTILKALEGLTLADFAKPLAKENLFI